MSRPRKIAITGAAGQIGYQLVFRIASGSMLGPDQPVSLHLLEIAPALPALEGVVMELRDAAFPLLHDIVTSDQAPEAFDGVDLALLVGARPRGPGMERKDLLEANAEIFSVQGKALNEKASRDVKVLVVGNPANTNALIAASNAPNLDRSQFSAMTRLDHNRAVGQLAAKTGSHPTLIRRMTVWGNHSTTQYPDISQCTVDGSPATELVDDGWYKDEFIPTVQKRGAAIIKARGASSAASAASAAVDAVRDWVHGTPEDDWTSMAIPSGGQYGVKEGVYFSYPVTCRNGRVSVVEGLPVSSFSKERLAATEKELREERSAIERLLG